MEIANKRKADEDQQGQPEKKSKNEREEQGAKRGSDEWVAYAKDLKAGAERRAEESKKAKVGYDMDGDRTMEAIEAINWVQ